MKSKHHLVTNVLYSLRHPLIRAGLVVTGVALVTAFLVGAGYWFPTRNDVENMSKSVDIKRREIIDGMRSERVYLAYLKAAQQIPVLESKLNASVRQADIVRNIDKLAGRRAVKIISSSYEEGREKNGYSQLYLDMVVQADYQGLREFLIDIPALPTWTLIEEASISRLDGAQELVKAQLRLSTYRRYKKEDGMELKS